MTVQLSQKERMLLQDQIKHEEVCIQKYNNYSNQAQDPQLKQLFKSYADQEQNHYNTLNQILNGQVPNMGKQQSQQSQAQGGAQNQAQSEMISQTQGGMQNQKDATLCADMLMTEKYVSNAYDTAIFEFKNSNIRQALNHIQKVEQQHGQGIFNYMNSKGLYNTQ
ncbi:MAG TPA: spore coat protein [Clostridiales bacterium]|nr:spore coat protein [Clostridiales bacterium]